MTIIKPPNNDAVLIMRNFPRHVRDHFKAWCAKRGKTMKDALVEFMRSCIKKDGD